MSVIYLGCDNCRFFNSKGLTCRAYPDRIPLPIISGEAFHLKPMLGQKNDVLYSPVKSYELVLKNKDRFIGSTFLNPTDYEEIGWMEGGDRIIKIGYEDGDTNSPLVARVTLEEDDFKETVAIAPLYSLMTMVPQDVNLYKEGERVDWA